jgi:DNA-binding PadR family transcriptional regulator
MNLLSRTEELLLLAVWRLQDEAYGAAIRNHLTDITDEDWSIGSVYGTLDRLARQGLVRTFMGLPTPERGGRSKRYFQLTAEGVAALNRVRSVQKTMWEDLPGLAPGKAQ